MHPKDVAFILNALRQASVKWEGRREALRRARKRVKIGIGKTTGRPLWKFHWQCATCKDWFDNVKSMEVDHVVEIGGFQGDWNETISRMFPRSPDALQVLCTSCHMKKTLAFNNARLRFQRKK